MQDSSKSWYDKKIILLLLFFFLPPLGIYAMIKHHTKEWKKAVYVVAALPLAMVQFFLIFSLLISPFTDSSKNGKTNQLKRDRNTIVEVNENGVSDKEGKDAKALENASITERERKRDSFLNLHRKFWSDSIVNFWDGDFIVGNDLSKKDTISFLFSKNATRNYEQNSEMYHSIYSDKYAESVRNKFNDTLRDNSLVIHFLGNQTEFEEQRIEMGRKEEILQQFNPFTMEHRKLKRLVKSGMHDPDSYNHIQTTFEDKNSYVLVKTSFRGKNVYGATVVNNVTVKADLEGNIIEIINQN